MQKVSRKVPFRWILPLVQLAVCVALVWPLWLTLGRGIWGYFQRSAPTSTVVLKPQFPVYYVDLPIEPEETRGVNFLEMRMRAPAALNIPVGLMQLPYVIFSRDKNEWTPSGVKWIPEVLWFLETWRAILWPLIGIIFWWMVGRSVEALVAARQRVASPRISLIESAFGLSFVVLGLLICAVFVFEMSPTRTWADLIYGFGGGLWAALGVVVVVASFKQWKIRRLQKKQILQPA